jgi:hypothetical protein
MAPIRASRIQGESEAASVIMIRLLCGIDMIHSENPRRTKKVAHEKNFFHFPLEKPVGGPVVAP